MVEYWSKAGQMLRFPPLIGEQGFGRSNNVQTAVKIGQILVKRRSNA
jgi:hypothetical protein